MGYLISSVASALILSNNIFISTGSASIILKIDELERKFERKYPFGTFQDFNERHSEFIKFIEESSKPKELPTDTPFKKTITRERVEKIQEEKPSPPEPPVQAESFFRKSIAYLTPQIHGVGDVVRLIIFLSLATLVNFYIFWGLASV